MKKIFAIAVLAFVLTAGCGSADTKKAITSTETKETAVQTTAAAETTAEVLKGGNGDFEEIFKVSGKNIYMGVPNWQKVNEGYTNLFIIHGDKYIAITKTDVEDVTDVKKAHEIAYDEFLASMDGTQMINELEISSDKTETINGIEMYGYEGIFHCGKNETYDAYVIGYSFIYDGIPVNITGSVLDESQPQAAIDEIKDTVGKMLLTIRSEKGE